MRSLALHILLVALALIVLTPIAWLICASFKRQEDMFAYAFLPWNDVSRLTFDNFRLLFGQVPFARWLTNSLFIASTQTVLVVTLSSLAGFALAKHRFRGRRTLMLAMLVTLVLPYPVLIPGAWDLMYRIGWLDSYLAIIVPGGISVIGVLLFRQAMIAVPDELLHAARVDGCSELRLWWAIALPIVRPMVGAFTLLAFLGNYNSLLWPQIVLHDAEKYTLPIGLSNMLGLPAFESNYGVLMAGTLLSVLPVIALFFILQKDLETGIAAITD